MSALEDWIDCDAEHGARCECVRSRTLAELKSVPFAVRGVCDCGTDAQRDAARLEFHALRERVADLEAVRDAAIALLNVHDDNDDDSPFPSILVHERNEVRSALQRLNANDAVRTRRALTAPANPTNAETEA